VELLLLPADHFFALLASSSDVRRFFASQGHPAELHQLLEALCASEPVAKALLEQWPQGLNQVQLVALPPGDTPGQDQPLPVGYRWWVSSGAVPFASSWELSTALAPEHPDAAWLRLIGLPEQLSELSGASPAAPQDVAVPLEITPVDPQALAPLPG
jgi:hypothetical protein